jgi:large subunit ribosomal protein L7/L12
MTTSKINSIITELKTITLLEAAELVKSIETIFGVDASANNNMLALGASNSNAAKPIEVIEEKTEFDLILTEVPADKKIAILKVVRTITGLGLKEAKDLVESTPQTLKQGITKEACEIAKKQLEDVGAKVTLK